MFSYSLENLFTEISNETIYNARTRFAETGASLIDLYSITEDERAFFNLKINEVADEIMQLSIRIFSKYEIEDDITFSLSTKNKSKYLELLSNHISTYIKDSVIYLWYISVSLNDMADIYIKKLEPLAMAIKALILKVGHYKKSNTFSIRGYEEN